MIQQFLTFGRGIFNCLWGVLSAAPNKFGYSKMSRTAQGLFVFAAYRLENTLETTGVHRKHAPLLGELALDVPLL